MQFRWSGAVQTVCPFCHSILVRDDLALHQVGKVADLPPDPSPISLYTEGSYRGKPFWVVGRILYEYENGGWNEWHIVFNDNSSGWLSDAQLQYAISFRAPANTPLPPAQELYPGKHVVFANVDYEVSTITQARYKGLEGELPFQFHDKSEMRFVDLRTAGRAFGTLDFSEQPPLLFLGEWVSYEDLQLKNVRQFEGWV